MDQFKSSLPACFRCRINPLEINKLLREVNPLSSLVCIILLFSIFPVLADSQEKLQSEAVICDAIPEQVVAAEQLYLSNQFEQAQAKLKTVVQQSRICNDLSSEGWALKHLSATYYYMQETNQSRNNANLVRAIAMKINDDDLLANAINLIGLTYFQQEDYQQAIQYYSQAEQHAENYPKTKFKVIYNRGDAHYWDLNYDEAVKEFLSILPLASELGRDYNYNIFLKLAEIYFYQGDIKNSTKFSQQALAISKPGIEKANVHQNFAMIYSKDGQIQKEIDQLKLALSELNEVDSPPIKADLYKHVALLSIQLSKPDDAIEAANSLIKIGNLNDFIQITGVAWEILGKAQQQKNNYQAAIASFSKAYIIAEQQQAQPQMYTSSMQLFFAYSEIANYIQARNLLVNRLQYKDLETEYKLDYIKSLGQLYEVLGDYNASIKNYMQQLQTAKLNGDVDSILNAYELLGNTYYNGGFYQQSFDTYQILLELAKTNKNLAKQAATLANLAWAYRSLNDYDAAQVSAKKSVELAKKVNDPWVQWQALNANLQLQLLTHSGNPVDTAQKMLELDRESDSLYKGSSLISMADAYAQTGDTQQAIEYYSQALKLSQNHQDSSEQGNILNYMATLYLNQGNYQQAESNFRQAINLLESTQLQIANADKHAVSYADRQRSVYQGLIKSLVEQQKIGEALEISELGRAKALANLVNRRVDANKTTASVVDSIKLDEIIELAKQHRTTLVEYAITLDAIYVWVVSPEGEIQFEKIHAFIPSAVLTPAAVASRKDTTAVDISQLIADTRGAVILNNPELGLPDNNQNDVLLRNLYDFLISPIDKYLPDDNKQRVVFIPQGDLLQIPFAALKDSDGRYLIEKHTLQIATSVKLLQLANSLKRSEKLQSQENITPSVLVVGNPQSSSGSSTRLNGLSLLPLPGAQDEALKIAKLLGTDALIGEQASEFNIRKKISDASIIHFATHGLLEYGHPGESGVSDVPGAIVLAAASSSAESNNDGLLTAAEIMQIPLSAELAVLSACNTGNGRITADGVVGLSRAFMAAGVPSIVVTLWAIPDAPTATLMVWFYRNLKKSENKAQALRQAMLTTMKLYPNPRDWAAFILLGEAI